MYKEIEIPREGEAVVIKFFRIASVARLSKPSQTLRNSVDSVHVDHWWRRICRQWQPRRPVHLRRRAFGAANDHGICSGVVSFNRRGFQFCLARRWVVKTRIGSDSAWRNNSGRVDYPSQSNLINHGVLCALAVTEFSFWKYFKMRDLSITNDIQRGYFSLCPYFINLILSIIIL